MTKKLSVIIPMYNEEENVANTLKKVNDVLDSINIDSEVIVVNDGSTDRTLEILKAEVQKYKRFKIATYERNRNLGYALKFGFERASGDYIITIDSDLSYDAKYITDLYHQLERTNFDIIQGSPYMKGGGVLGLSSRRLLISKISNKFIGYAIGANIHTVTGMLRGYRREVLDSLYLEANGPQIMVEILAKASLLGFKIKEIPAVLKGREKGKSKFQNQVKKVAAEYFSLLFAEKPIVFFKMSGFFLLFVSLLYLVYQISRYVSGVINLSDPIITNPVVILIVLGVLTLFFSIILQNMTQLKRDLLIIQKQNKELYRKLKGEK